MRYERKEFVQRDTGEMVLAFVTVEQLRQLESGYGTKRAGKWVATMQPATEALSLVKMPPTAYRLFLNVVSKIGYDNAIVMDQRLLAKTFKVHESQISRALTALIKFGALERLPVPGGGYAYRLNPLFAYRGSAQQHNKAMAEAARRWGTAK